LGRVSVHAHTGFDAEELLGPAFGFARSKLWASSVASKSSLAACTARQVM
jgi:hypothetical protein